LRIDASGDRVAAGAVQSPAGVFAAYRIAAGVIIPRMGNRFSWHEEEPGWHLFCAIVGLLLFLLGCHSLATAHKWLALAYSHELALDLLATVCGLLTFTIDMVRFFRLRKRNRVLDA
jgi:hypothetical protein